MMCRGVWWCIGLYAYVWGCTVMYRDDGDV